MVRPFSRTSLKLSAVSAAGAAGAWFLYHHPPASTPYYPKCAFYVLTGLQCPGCGATRALYELLHGHVHAAWLLNPILFALLACALFALPAFIRGETPRFLTRPWFGWGSFVVLSGWWVVRNL